MCELCPPDRGLHVGHVRLEPRVADLVFPARARRVTLPGIATHPVEPRAAQVRLDLGIVGCDHAALADGEVLGRVEAEAGRRRQGPNVPLADPRPKCVGGVLHHPGERQPRRLRHLLDRSGVAREVQGHHGVRASRAPHRSSCGFAIRHLGLWIHVNEDGPQARVDDRVDGAAEGHRRGQDPGPGRQPQGSQGQLNCSRAR